MYPRMNKRERECIAELKELAEKWPESLWIFADGILLNVLKTKKDGTPAYNLDGEVDENYLLAEIEIPNDFGDW
jgi:hypothetical protein